MELKRRMFISSSAASSSLYGPFRHDVGSVQRETSNVVHSRTYRDVELCYLPRRSHQSHHTRLVSPTSCLSGLAIAVAAPYVKESMQEKQSVRVIPAREVRFIPTRFDLVAERLSHVDDC